MPDYVIEGKGEEFRDAFVDPGPAFDPVEGPGDRFFRAVVEQAGEIVIAFGHDGTISYANDAVRVHLGRNPADLVGSNALELVAADDLENAALTIHNAAQVVGWRPPRPFRLVHADGRWITFEVAGLSLFDDPDVGAIVIVARWADAAHRVDRVVGLLAAQRPVTEVLAELVHLLHRPGWELSVALQYDDGTGTVQAVTSDPTPSLAGLDALDEGPWAAARRSGAPVVDVGLSTVPDAVRKIATAAGFVSCWAVPVRDPSGVPACVVVWNGEAVEPELGQDLVLQRLVSLVELALDGRAQSSALDKAANCDPLTGLWNRRYLEAVAARTKSGNSANVAFVLCDLDGFKQVNDSLGHPAGDLVIQTVGQRLRAAVRDSDVVARFGGDEFAILCTGVADVAQLEAVATRIVDAVCQPIPHEESAIRVGISVGAAFADRDTDWGFDQLMREADAKLLDAKAAGKATFRIALVA